VFSRVFQEIGHFPQKTLNSAAQLISVAKQQIRQLGSKYTSCGKLWTLVMSELEL